MKTLHIACYASVAAALLLSACALPPAAPGHVKRDPRSICRAGDPYCESRKPSLDANGDMVSGLPKPGDISESQERQK